MNSVQKKLEELEKLKKEMSDKLDKYEYNFNKDKEKIDLSLLKNSKENNNEILGKNYKQIMNKRLDDIMGKIDDNIINQNYSNFYKFLSKGSPYIKSKNIIKKPVEEIKQEEKEIIPKENNLNKSEEEIKNEIQKENEEISEEKKEKSENDKIKTESKELEEEKIVENKNRVNNIHINYNGAGKIDLEELKSKQDLELLHKQQNIFLSNELTLLKCKLNKLRKDNEFLQSVINEKGMVKNTNVLEKFIGKFVERLSLNWDDIVNMIIDEMLLEEIYKLNEIDLKKINYEKNKNILIKNLVRAGFGGIMPENEGKENDINTNMDIIIENFDFLQKMLNNVKQTENDMKIKYNIK